MPDPRSFSISDVNFIEQIFEDSNIKVHSIINLIVVYRKLVEKWSVNGKDEGVFVDLWSKSSRNKSSFRAIARNRRKKVHLKRLQRPPPT